MHGSTRPAAIAATVALLAFPLPARPSAVSIRPDRLLDVDGEPFFPIGLHDLGPTMYDDWNQRIRNSGANVVWDFEIAYGSISLNCRAVVDSARASGYKLLLGSFNTLWWDDLSTPELEVDAPMYEEAALDALIDCVDREPEVLLGFTNRDEPVWTIAQGWIGGIDADHIHDTYAQIHARVDSTIVAMNFAPVNVSGDFDTWKSELLPFLSATDIVMHASYPYPAGEGTCVPLNVLGWPDCSMDRLATNADVFLSEINRPDQPLWMILQSFKDIPLKEARWEAYASIVHRATGIFWAGWTWTHPLGDGADGWPVTVAVMSEIASLHEFLVGDEMGGTRASHSDVEARAMRRRPGDEVVAFAISRHGYRGSASIRLPGAPSDSGGVSLVKEDRALTAVDGWITDDFDGYEAHGYRYAYRPEPDVGGSVSGSRFTMRAFPSPASDTIHLAITLPREALVTVTAYDAAGRRIGPVSEGTFPSGSSEILWNGCDTTGRRIPPGIYFLHGAGAGGLVATAKLIVLR